MHLNLTNPTEMTRDDFKRIVQLNNFEVFNSDKVDAMQKGLGETIQKSESGEISEEEKNKSDIIKAELGSLTKVIVLNDDLKKSEYFVRDKQVEFDEKGLEKGENGEIISAKSGTFIDTELNRKLNRVGEKFGEEKIENE